MLNRRHCHRAAPVAYRTAARPNKPAGADRSPKTDAHRVNALTLLARAGRATTDELAHDLELSAQYLGVLLRNLECEGRLTAVKDGRRRAWELAS